MAVAGVVIDQDTTIDGMVDWTDEDYTISANVTVADGGFLNVSDITLTFDSALDTPVGLVVEAGGTLMMDGVTCEAKDDPYIITSAGKLDLTSSSFSGLMSRNTEVGITASIGGILTEGGTVTMVDVTIEAGGVGMTLLDTEFHMEGLTVSDGQFGILMKGSEGSIIDASLSDLAMGIAAQDSMMEIIDMVAVDINWTMWAMGSEVTIIGMESTSLGDHLTFENCTTSVTDSEFIGGELGVVALLGFMEVRNCHFKDLSSGVELLYAEGYVEDVVVDDPYDVGIVLNFVGYSTDSPRFRFDNVTVRRGTEAAIEIEASGPIELSNVTIEGCGDGFDINTAIVTLRDVIITGATQCRPVGCSYRATGTGVYIESSTVHLHNVTIDGSNGPGLTAWFSEVYTHGSAFLDGNASGIMLIYTWVTLDGCEVSGNARWGVESLGYDLDVDSMDATWGNTLADVRKNITVNARVYDQNGKWLSHADVTATSGDVTVGPYRTGFEGVAPTFELPLSEWTDGAADHDFNPYTFLVEYEEFSNSTQVDLVLGVGQISLYVEVPRADLRVINIKVSETTPPNEEVLIGAIVINQGNYTVESAILTFYYRDENGFQRVIGETAIGPLEPGMPVDESVPWTPTTKGDYYIIAYIDVDDDVDEEDETNNNMERMIEVTDEANGGLPGPGALLALAAFALGALLLSSSMGRRRR